MEAPLPAIASLKDPKAAQKGFCTVFLALSPDALRLTPYHIAIDTEVVIDIEADSGAKSERSDQCSFRTLRLCVISF